MKILFLHGWNSAVGGVKPTFLNDHGHEVINPALPDEDMAEAIRIAQAEFDKHQPQVIVGSSRGGAVAMNIDSGYAKLVLLCPAWKKYGAARSVKPDTVILHSRADDVISFADSEEFGDTLAISRMLLGDKGDLIHKATGWMLREVGKKDRAALEGFLQQHGSDMPRTMLRYAIERFTPDQRQVYLRKKTISTEGAADGV